MALKARKVAAIAASVLAAIALAWATAATTQAQAASDACPWAGSHAPTATRVQELLAAMTLDDKLAMVDGVGYSSPNPGYGGYVAPNSGLCIPAITLQSGSAGVGGGLNGGVTQLPAPVALAASFDPQLAKQYGAVVGSEDRGKGVDVDLGPMVDTVRDPRWGRAWENYGEDPYLSGQTAVGYIDGVQSQGVMAQVNDFAVYNEETNRTLNDAIVSDRTMQEIYLPQFKAAATQGHASSVMCGYTTVNGEYTCQNDYLYDVLDKQWKFPGFVTSDWGATQSTVASAQAGLDLSMPGGTILGPDYYGAALKAAIEDGQVPVSALNEMVSRILTEMFRFGMFNHPATGSPTNTVTTPAHARTGESVAESGTVLLKNSDNILPLHAKSIAVIGSDGGTYALTSAGGGTSVNAPYVVTPQEGITSRAAKAGVSVSYTQGDIPARTALASVPDADFPGGLTATYYNDTTESGPVAATGKVSGLTLDWAGESPAPGVDATGWSAKLTGTLDVPAAGTYALSLSLNGTASVTVDGQQVFPSAGAFGSVSSASVTLPAGPVSIEVDYADIFNTGVLNVFPYDDGLTLGWQSTAGPLAQAVAAAKKAAVAVVFASNYESEGADLTTINLPAVENDLIDAVATANPNTIVVLNTGSAVTMPWLSKVKGVIEAWYPGQNDGNDIAAVLFGDVNPSGKLPVTFPKSLSQVPDSTAAQWPGVDGKVEYSEGLLVGYRWYTTKGITPLFPFGYGLSYTTFAFSHLRVSPSRDGVRVTVDVTNTGHVAGADVTQLYVGDPASTGEPAEQLKGFQRVTLQPGQTRPVTLTLDRSAFEWYDSDGWTLTPGTYRLMVGDSSANLPLTAAVYLR
jgi:beta-glucosidase